MKVFGIVALLLAVAGVSIWYATGPEPIDVKLYTVQKGTVKSTVSNTRVGTVKACRRAYLAPAAGGQVAELAVGEGSAVREGQVLMRVWNKDLHEQVALDRADLVGSRASAQESCAVAAGVEREANRLLKLQKYKQIVSEDTVDKKVTESQARRAACEAAKASIAVK
ncbi:MAG: biotin/lipoyl-binding protein, partial [Methylococcales bacterium]